jgi:hypothetical protein
MKGQRIRPTARFAGDRIAGCSQATRVRSDGRGDKSITLVKSVGVIRSRDEKNRTGHWQNLRSTFEASPCANHLTIWRRKCNCKGKNRNKMEQWNGTTDSLTIAIADAAKGAAWCPGMHCRLRLVHFGANRRSLETGAEIPGSPQNSPDLCHTEAEKGHSNFR